MDNKCKSCGGSGRRLQPIPIGKTMGLMPVTCNRCKGTGKEGNK